jgi:DivIVA domain-containing protein
VNTELVRKHPSSSGETPQQSLARLQRSTTAAATGAAPNALVNTPLFTVVKWRKGYDINQVNEFVSRISRRTSSEIRNVRFKTVRGGYHEHEVDDYLEAQLKGRS